MAREKEGREIATCASGPSNVTEEVCHETTTGASPTKMALAAQATMATNVRQTKKVLHENGIEERKLFFF